jgi:hypothetical protein
MNYQKFWFVLFFSVILNSCSTTKNRDGSINVELEYCMKNADLRAKAYAEVQEKKVIEELKQSSLLKGGLLGVGCSIVTFFAFTPACVAAGTAYGSADYLSRSEANSIEAERTFEQALQDKQNQLYGECRKMYE